MWYDTKTNKDLFENHLLSESLYFFKFLQATIGLRHLIVLTVGKSDVVSDSYFIMIKTDFRMPRINQKICLSDVCYQLVHIASIIVDPVLYSKTLKFKVCYNHINLYNYYTVNKIRSIQVIYTALCLPDLQFCMASSNFTEHIQPVNPGKPCQISLISYCPGPPKIWKNFLKSNAPGPYLKCTLLQEHVVTC